MGAGGPGDHPLSDILYHKILIYNKKCDELILRISKLVPFSKLGEMYDWPDNFKITKNQLTNFEQQLKQKLEELENNSNA